MKANTEIDKANEATAKQAALDAYLAAMQATTDAARNELLVHPAITRDQVRESIKTSATLLGCDTKQAVSGAELLAMFTLTLRKFGLMPDAPSQAVRDIIAGFDSNSSAMTKRLYEGNATTTAVVKYGGAV